jgi:hypothetical protein
MNLNFTFYKNPSTIGQIKKYEKLTWKLPKAKKLNLVEGKKYKVSDYVDLPKNKKVNLMAIDFNGGNNYKVLGDSKFPSLSGTLERLPNKGIAEMAAAYDPFSGAKASALFKLSQEFSLNLELEFRQKKYRTKVDPLSVKRRTASTTAFFFREHHKVTVDAFTRDGEDFVVAYDSVLIVEQYFVFG